MEFEYKPVAQFSATVDIEDIGQCALEAMSDANTFYYLIIRTVMGETTVFEYGPIVPDIKRLPNEVISKKITMEYNDTKINGMINKFIADRRGVIIEAVRVVTFEEALSSIKDLVVYMRGVIESGE